MSVAWHPTKWWDWCIFRRLEKMNRTYYFFYDVLGPKFPDTSIPKLIKSFRPKRADCFCMQ